ncbi:YolD-like family protein [Sporosarcina sp. FSL W7-1349]|uniref:YolD-like family protein n=1 Tax=Sporosarcina sp. FSL W7-1349 TaxID=2921561 RepID=UPI0030F8E725
MKESIRDRGAKKWSMSIMLPEHVQKLREWYDEDNYVARPHLDNFDLQVLQHEIERAYKRQCETKIEVWKAGRIDLYMGKICELDPQLGCISIEGPFGHDRISVHDIVSVQCVD